MRPSVSTSSSQRPSPDASPVAPASADRRRGSGELLVEPVLDSEWNRIAELTEAYVDLPLGMTDASVVALAERQGLDTIASFDHRHLAAIRPRHVERFTLVP